MYVTQKCFDSPQSWVKKTLDYFSEYFSAVSEVTSLVARPRSHFEHRNYVFKKLIFKRGDFINRDCFLAEVIKETSRFF